MTRFTGFARSTIRHWSAREPREDLRARIKALAGERPRWGCRRIHDPLRREGWRVNRERVRRLHRGEGLAVRRRGEPRRRGQAPRPVREPLAGPDERWSLDFMEAALSSGRRFRRLAILDECGRESLAVHVARSIPAAGVIEVLERLRKALGPPGGTVTDDGSEFTSRAFDAWAHARGVKLECVQPGEPARNRFVESFKGTLRDECLNLHWLLSPVDARRTTEAWRRDYDEARPHGSPGGLTPREFGARCPRRDKTLAITETVPLELDQLRGSPQDHYHMRCRNVQHGGGNETSPGIPDDSRS